jgi:transcriptional regulator with XRE-family HTH domain
MRRIEINMSQEFLGEQIDVTFQQIQKYEKGANRVVAGRIQQIGKALEVPTSFSSTVRRRMGGRVRQSKFARAARTARHARWTDSR